MQQYAVCIFILLQYHCTYIGCRQHLSSGVYKTEVTTTGTSQWLWGQIWPRWSEVAARPYDLYQWLSILYTLDDGCRWHLKHVEWYCSKMKYKLHIVASRWTFINPYPTAFPYGNGMVLHFYQQQESSTTKTVHKVINKGLKTYV